MPEVKWRHFGSEIGLWAVRRYYRYGISYRDLEQMMDERDPDGDRPANKEALQDVPAARCTIGVKGSRHGGS